MEEDLGIPIQQRIFETRITRELGEIFGSGNVQELEMTTGLFLSFVCDTMDGLPGHGRGVGTDQKTPAVVPQDRTNEASLVLQQDDSIVPPTIRRRYPVTSQLHRRSSHLQKKANSSRLHKASQSLGDALEIIDYVTFNNEQTSFDAKCSLLRQYISAPNAVIRWCPSLESFKALQSFADNVCVAVIEIPSNYPITTPRVAIVHFKIQQNENWYQRIFNSDTELDVSKLMTYDSSTHKPEPLQHQPKMGAFRVRDALPLSKLNCYRTTRLILGEPWSPGISLKAILVRLAAVVREQVISHVYYHQRYPEMFHSECHTSSCRQLCSVSDQELPISQHTESRSSSEFRSPLKPCDFETTVISSNIDLRIVKIRYPWLSIFSVLFVSVILRIIINCQVHTRQVNASQYGDYEERLYWRSLIVNVPFNQWYTAVKNHTGSNTPSWVFNYPPLAAYHEYFMAVSNQWFYPRTRVFNQLSLDYALLGNEIFMRGSIILSDLLIFHTAAVFFWICLPDDVISPSREPRLLCLLLFLCCPVFILLDYGHFQYNSVALGLVLWAVNCLAIGQQAFAVIFYTLAVLYNQANFYSALPFAFFLFGLNSHRILYNGWLIQSLQPLPTRALIHRSCQLIGISLFVAILIVLPFLLAGTDAPIAPLSFMEQVLIFLRMGGLVPMFRRIVTFYHGNHGDYVTNVWAAVEPLIKIDHLAEIAQISVLAISTGLTLLGPLPPCIALLKRPTFNRFRYALIWSSLCFYLFSPTTRKEAILLPVASSLLLLPLQYDFATLFGLIGTLCIFFLMIKDCLTVAFLGCAIIWVVACVYVRPNIKSWNLPPNRMSPNLYNTSPKTLIILSWIKLYRWCSIDQIKEFVKASIVFIIKVLLLGDSMEETFYSTNFSNFLGTATYTFKSLFPLACWSSSSVQFMSTMACLLLVICQVAIPLPIQYLNVYIYLRSLFCCLMLLFFGFTAFNQVFADDEADTDDLSGLVSKMLLVGPSLNSQHVVARDLSENVQF